MNSKNHIQNMPDMDSRNIEVYKDFIEQIQEIKENARESLAKLQSRELMTDAAKLNEIHEGIDGEANAIIDEFLADEETHNAEMIAPSSTRDGKWSWQLRPSGR